MHKVLFKHKKYLLFVFIIFIISLIVGILYYYFLDNSTKLKVISSIRNYNFHINNVLKDLIIMSTILITSFFIIGLPLSIIYLSYESFTLGFVINIFLITYKIKGIIYVLIYLLIRIIPLILIIFFTYKIINISRYVIGYLIYKDNNIKDKIIINFKNSIYIILFILIVNIIIYYVSKAIII